MQQKTDRRRLRRPKITARAAEESEQHADETAGEITLSDEEGEESLYKHVKRHAGHGQNLIPSTQYEVQMRLREQERREKQKKKMEVLRRFHGFEM